ncbi:MAG: family 10 glycosylhydrolase [Planctomycetota bacterium]
MNRLRNILAASLAFFAPLTVAPLVRAQDDHDRVRRFAEPEVRGTWVTTTANTHIRTPKDTAATMRTLREIGLNTVYVETWKNGYTQYPSDVLERLIGVDRRPDLVPQDPSDPPEVLREGARDLLLETMIEAHRNQLLYIGWFEYGFMAAHNTTDNHLRRMKPEWLSQDINGNTVAPNGFVWMNPLHPEARRFLLDIILEAVDRYDMDGVQLDDRIVWPYVTMGYDPYTRAVYANEHGGKQPPEDHTDPEWMAWRAKKVDDYAKQFVSELQQKRPGLLVSLSPAPYPWCYEHYLLDWPDWARQGLWDEYIPQCYRYDYDAFVATWDQQAENLKRVGGRADVSQMLAGVLTTGSRPDPVPWSDLERSIRHVRDTGGGGHVWWFSRGVLDEYPEQIKAFYDVEQSGRAPHPQRLPQWRPEPVALIANAAGEYRLDDVPVGNYRVIVKQDDRWTRPMLLRIGPNGRELTMIGSGESFAAVRNREGVFERVGDAWVPAEGDGWPPSVASLPIDSKDVEAVELLVDRRYDMTSELEIPVYD